MSIRAFTRVRMKNPKSMKKEIGNYIFKAENRKVKKALNYLFKKVKESITLERWSKDQLKAMGHPYAKRHGYIQKGVISPRYVYQVGSKGSFPKGLKKKFIPASFTNDGAIGRIYYEDGSKWAEAIFTGSKKMIKRNPIRGVARSRPVKREIRKILFGKAA